MHQKENLCQNNIKIIKYYDDSTAGVSFDKNKL